MPESIYLVQQRDENEEAYYVVMKGNSVLGYTWKEEVFSYRGTEGWNSGVRIRDFHPIEWKAAVKYRSFEKLSFKTRKEALRWFLEPMGLSLRTVNTPPPEPATP